MFTIIKKEERGRRKMGERERERKETKERERERKELF